MLLIPNYSIDATWGTQLLVFDYLIKGYFIHLKRENKIDDAADPWEKFAKHGNYILKRITIPQ